jgi:hypothetical protein
MIPERVEAVTSVTPGRGRRFATPVGLFLYRRVPPASFPIGVDQVRLEGGRSFLMAVPEKALADKIQDDRGTAIRGREEMRQYLAQSLRIDAESLEDLSAERVGILAGRYGSRKLRLLESVLARLRQEGGAHE